MSGSSPRTSGQGRSDAEDASGERGAPPGSDGTSDAIARLVHDMRNPLNTISMNAELVGLEVGESVSGELGESLCALERAVGELERGLVALETHVSQGDGGARHG